MQPKTSSITINICISSFVMWKQFLSHLITIKLHLLFEMMEGAYLTAIHGCCLLVLIEWNQATLQNVIPCIRQWPLHYEPSILLEESKCPMQLSSFDQLNDSSDSFQIL